MSLSWVKDKSPLYDLIYSLNLVKLETLKFYIEIYLKTEFIQLFKSFLGVFMVYLSFSIENQIKTSAFVFIIKV